MVKYTTNNDDQVFETSFKMETDWGNNDTGKAVEDAIEAQLKSSEALSKFNEKLAQSSKVDGDLQDQFTELQFQCDRRASEIDSVVFRMADLIQCAYRVRHGYHSKLPQ